jgi:hypothetical protein
MGRSIYLIVLLGLLSGCVPIFGDPSRDSFGVSTARPDAGNAPVADPQLAALDAKANAVCTLGYGADAPGVLPAQNDQQLVDQKLRCDHYDHIRFDLKHIEWSNVL